MRHARANDRWWLLAVAMLLMIGGLGPATAIANSTPRLAHVAVDVVPGSSRVRLRCSVPTPYSWERASEPERLVLRFPHASCEGLAGIIAVEEGGIDRIEIAAAAGGTQVTLWLTRRWPVELQGREADRELTLRLDTRSPAPPAPTVAAEPRPAGTGSTPPVAPRPPDPPAVPSAPSIAPPAPPAPARITRLRVVRQGNTSEIHFETTRGVLAFGRLLPGEPPRFYVDLEGATVEGLAPPAATSGPGLARVRFGERLEQQPIARIVADLQPRAVAQLDADVERGRYRIRVIAPEVRPPLPDRLGIVVALDPGHGGEDSGSLGPTGLREKDVTLDVALQTKALLEQMGFDVILSRDRDSTLPPGPRSTWLRAVQAHLLVSIHCDSVDHNPNVTGTTTFYRQGRPGSRELAETVHRSLVAAIGLPDRGVRLDTELYLSGLYVLRESPRPAILVETGFISHPLTEQRFRDPAFREQIAQGIAEGIRQYVLAGNRLSLRR